MNRRLRRSKSLKKAFYKGHPEERPIKPIKPESPPEGTECADCDKAMTYRKVPEDVPRTPASQYWFETDQNPDYDKRKYSMLPVCDFHAKLHHAMWTLHCRQQGITEPVEDGSDDLYGQLEPGSGEFEPEELEALMTQTLNERFTQDGVKFTEHDVLEAALEWTKDDILIIQAFAKILDAAASPGGYHSGGPPDIVR